MATKVKSYKVIHDPIHGNIELKPLLVKIIDTPEFQRLRFIKQLGGVYFVYPGASHNRFEHSIGVCHLAGRLVRALKNQKSKALEGVEITPVDELCVEIAALCHDLGHGPFSHLFDRQIIPGTRPDKIWEHEQGSIDMFDHMLEHHEELKDAFQNENILKTDCEFIKEMIVGPPKSDSKDDTSKQDWKYKGRPKEKRFLYEIVSNKRNGIDVDKWDYFARDSYMLGIGNNFNFDRCIAFSRVIEVDGENQICFRDKEATNLYDMFHTRSLLHQRAYQHKTSNIIEHMLAEALVLADKCITFEGKDGDPICMSKTIDDMKAYTFLTDSVINQILERKTKTNKKTSTEEKNMQDSAEDRDLQDSDEEKNMKYSKEILKRILSRDLYECLGEKRFPGGSFKNKDAVKKDIVSTMDDKPKYRPFIENIAEAAVINLVKLNYGKKDKDPIAFVNFYSKTDPDKAEPRKKEDVSLLLPTVFEEQLVRVYWKKLEDYTDVKEMFNVWAKSTTKAIKKEKTEEIP